MMNDTSTTSCNSSDDNHHHDSLDSSISLNDIDLTGTCTGSVSPSEATVEGISLLRQIFPEESTEELKRIHRQRCRRRSQQQQQVQQEQVQMQQEMQQEIQGPPRIQRKSQSPISSSSSPLSNNNNNNVSHSHSHLKSALGNRIWRQITSASVLEFNNNNNNNNSNNKSSSSSSSKKSTSYPYSQYCFQVEDDFLRLPPSIAVRRYNSNTQQWHYELLRDLQQQALQQHRQHSSATDTTTAPTNYSTNDNNINDDYQHSSYDYDYFTRAILRDAQVGLGLTLCETPRRKVVRVHSLHQDEATTTTTTTTTTTSVSPLLLEQGTGVLGTPGPSLRAGLQPGDELIGINGTALLESFLLLLHDDDCRGGDGDGDNNGNSNGNHRMNHQYHYLSLLMHAVSTINMSPDPVVLHFRRQRRQWKQQPLQLRPQQQLLSPSPKRLLFPNTPSLLDTTTTSIPDDSNYELEESILLQEEEEDTNNDGARTFVHASLEMSLQNHHHHHHGGGDGVSPPPPQQQQRQLPNNHHHYHARGDTSHHVRRKRIIRFHSTPREEDEYELEYDANDVVYNTPNNNFSYYDNNNNNNRPRRPRRLRRKKKKKKTPLIHPFVATLRAHGLLQSYEEERQCTRQLEQFTRRIRHWEATSSFRFFYEQNTTNNNNNSNSKATEHDSEEDDEEIMEWEDYNDYCNDNEYEEHCHHYHPNEDYYQHVGDTLSTPTTNMTAAAAAAAATPPYPYDSGGMNYYQQQHLYSDPPRREDNVFIPLIGVRKALSVRILNSFLETSTPYSINSNKPPQHDSAYSIWVYDVESGKEFFSPIRYDRDFQDLRAATLRLNHPVISALPFPKPRRRKILEKLLGVASVTSGTNNSSNNSNGYYSPTGIGGGLAGFDSVSEREGTCRQLEFFLRSLCTMIYRHKMHPAVAEIAIHVQSFLGCDTVPLEDDYDDHDDDYDDDNDSYSSSLLSASWSASRSRMPTTRTTATPTSKVAIVEQATVGSVSATSSTTNSTRTNNRQRTIEESNAIHNNKNNSSNTKFKAWIRSKLKRSIQQYTYRLFLIDRVSSAVDSFIDNVRARGPTRLDEIEALEAQGRTALKSRAMKDLEQIKVFLDLLQNLIMEGCMDDFRSIARRKEYEAIFPATTTTATMHSGSHSNSHSAGDAYLERLVREAVREQVEIEVYVPLRSVVSRWLVKGWRHEDMEVQFKIRELRRRPQRIFRIPHANSDPSTGSCSTSSWSTVSKILSERVGGSTLPCVKLRAIVEAAQEISRLFSSEQKQQQQQSSSSSPTSSPSARGRNGAGADDAKLLGADDFLPIFIYCVVQAELERPCALCVLLRTLCDPINRMGEIGYYLASFEAAIAHIQEVDLSEDREEMLSFLSVPLRNSP